MPWLCLKFFQVFAEKNLIVSFSYSSANSSSIPVVHTLQCFFSFIFMKKPGYQAPWLCRFTLTSFLIYHYKQTFFQISVYHYLGWRINKLKPNSKEINDNPNINKQAHGLQRSFLLSTVRIQADARHIQSTYGFFKAFFRSKITYSRKTLPFRVSTPILPEISLWFDGHTENHCYHAISSRMCPWNSRKMDIAFIEKHE